MKTAVITGATSGIGLAVARALCGTGWRVIGVGRIEEHCDVAKKRLMESYPDADITFVFGDLSQQHEVHRVADVILSCLEKKCDGKLDALINNAGGVRSRYTTTAQGYETQFALNYLSAFLMTYRLFAALKSGGGRLILTGSGSHKKTRIRWHDIMYQNRYNPLMAYKQSKLAGMLFVREYNRRFLKDGLRAYVVDPGLVNTDIGGKQTGRIVQAFWSIRRRGGISPEEAVPSYIHLCTATKTPDGLYYRQCRACAYSRHADSEGDAKRLFDLSEQLCGIAFEGDD